MPPKTQDERIIAENSILHLSISPAAKPNCVTAIDSRIIIKSIILYNCVAANKKSTHIQTKKKNKAPDNILRKEWRKHKAQHMVPVAKATEKNNQQQRFGEMFQ